MGELASELHVFENILVWYNQALLQFQQSNDITLITSNPLISIAFKHFEVVISLD